MIKGAGVDADGQPVLLIGLSGENVTRLAAGEPIMFNCAELGLSPLTVVLCYGRTETTLADMLRQTGIIGDRTKVEEQ